MHIVDVFDAFRDVEIVALFGPEHGIRGKAEDGEKLDSAHDPLRDIPVYSLYGHTRKPTAEMLQKIDVLVFDIQDIGARYYTYIYTMALAMEAAAEHGIEFVVLDRPNPINGKDVEGNILEPAFSTFVGMFPIPVRHGMTVGELARLFNGEGWLADGTQAKLTVVPMANWRRELWFDETGLTFIKPSPNMPDLETATLYPGACLLEGTNVSEGRGTNTPFKTLGAPWIDSKTLAGHLNELRLPGVKFTNVSFTPEAIAGVASAPKFENRACHGVRIAIIDRDVLQPFWMGVQVVRTIHALYPDSMSFRIGHFDRLCGTKDIRNTITKNRDLRQLRKSWQTDLEAFEQKRETYLLYD